MKLTEQMKLMLFQVLSDSLIILGSPFILTRDSRVKLWEDIMKLQDMDLEVKENKNVDS